MNEDQKIRWIRVAVLLAVGIVVGLLSGATFNLGYYQVSGGDSLANLPIDLFAIDPEKNNYYGILPGFLFGMGLSSIYAYSFGQNRKTIKITGILFLGTACYLITRLLYGFLILYDFSKSSGKLGEFVMNKLPFMTGPPCFLSSLLMVMILKIMTKAYSWRQVIFISLLGGVVTSLTMGITQSASQKYWPFFFFVIWQATMTVAIGLPLLRLKNKAMS